MDEELAERARRLNVNVSSAARQGVADAVRAAMAAHDRAAYEQRPEEPDEYWDDSEAWGSE